MKAIPYLQNKADTKTYASHVPFSEESLERCTVSKQRKKNVPFLRNLLEEVLYQNKKIKKEKKIQWYLES